MGQVRGIADCGLGNAERGSAELVVIEIPDVCSAKERHECFDVCLNCRFIHRNTDRVGVEESQVAAGSGGALSKVGGGVIAQFDPDRVEEIVVCYFESELLQTFSEF